MCADIYPQHHRQLFLDDGAIESMSGLQRVLHQRHLDQHRDGRGLERRAGPERALPRGGQRVGRTVDLVDIGLDHHRGVVHLGLEQLAGPLREPGERVVGKPRLAKDRETGRGELERQRVRERQHGGEDEEDEDESVSRGRCLPLLFRSGGVLLFGAVR